MFLGVRVSRRYPDLCKARSVEVSPRLIGLAVFFRLRWRGRLVIGRGDPRVRCLLRFYEEPANVHLALLENEFLRLEVGSAGWLDLGLACLPAAVGTVPVGEADVEIGFFCGEDAVAHLLLRARGLAATRENAVAYVRRGSQLT